MKLDATAMRYLTKEHFRVLTAIEMGMKNHEVVPVELITSIAKLRHGGVNKILSHLLRNKLIAHDGNTYDGFRLTYSGYDFLAMKVFLERNHIAGLGRQIGVGKESDIFLATQEDGTEVAIKFHRLGRTSFRAVKAKRDYLKDRKSVSWFYMSRLSAMKEFAFLKALYERGFPTPVPIDCNRHAICMSLVDGYPLNQVRHLANSKEAYDTCMSIVVRLAECGLVHCDFNEFNIMINDVGKITMIDFPQMISTSHPNAVEYAWTDLCIYAIMIAGGGMSFTHLWLLVTLWNRLFDRDVKGLVKFFSRLQGGSYSPDSVPRLDDIVADAEGRLDDEVGASGFGKEYGERVHDLSIFSAHQLSGNGSDGDDDDDDDDDDDEEVDELAGGIDGVQVDDEDDKSDAGAGTDGEDEDYDEDALTADALSVQNELIKRRVQQTAQARMKAGKRKTRNNAKLSIKGKLYHKDHF